MDPDSIVAMLEPLREPGAVHWWPLAPGWWLLAALILSLLFYALRSLWRFHRRAAPIRAARRAFASLEAEELGATERATALGSLQRRVAIAVGGRRNCAGLTGEAWADFLNSLAKSDEPYFDSTLASLAYQPQINAQDCDDAFHATRRWLKDMERPR